MRHSRFFTRLTGAVAAGALALFALAGTAAAQSELSASGAVLDNVSVDKATADVSRTVSSSGDTVSASYVMAWMPDGRHLQRDADGYWRPWDGKAESLVDNGFRPSSNLITFKVLKEDLTNHALPINVTIAYKTGDTIKFGVFQILPQ